MVRMNHKVNQKIWEFFSVVIQLEMKRFIVATHMHKSLCKSDGVYELAECI